VDLDALQVREVVHGGTGMTNPAKSPLVRDLRGGRRPLTGDLQTQAAALAASIGGILSRHPEVRFDEIDLKGLWAALNRLAEQGVVLPPPDPMRLLSASQLGQELHGLREDMVWLREKDGALFSVLPSGRRRGRLYPAFQALDGIVGEPLASVLLTLRGATGNQHLSFFRQRRGDLDALTPVEVMLGQLLEPRDQTRAAKLLLMMEPIQRNKRVTAAAMSFQRECATSEVGSG